MSAKPLTKTEMEMLKEISKSNDIGRVYGANYRGKTISGTITIEKLIAKKLAKGVTTWHSAYSEQKAYITPAGLRAIGCTTAQDETVIEVSADPIALNAAQERMLRYLTTPRTIKHGEMSQINTARKLVRLGLATEKSTAKTSFFALTESGIALRRKMVDLPVIVKPVEVTPEKPFEPSAQLIKARALLAQIIEDFGPKHRMTYIVEFEVSIMERDEKKAQR